MRGNMWNKLAVATFFVHSGFVCFAENGFSQGVRSNVENHETSKKHQRYLRELQLTERKEFSVTVNFNKNGNDYDIFSGDPIDETTRFPGSVVIKAQRSGEASFGDGMLFDAREVSGNDVDLGNFPFLGNMFVISADNNRRDPKVAEVGGLIEVEFLDYPVKLNFIRFIDIDKRGSGLTLFDVDGNKIRGVAIPAMANGGQKLMTFANAVGVRSIRIRFAGSGAMDDINFFPPSSLPLLGPKRLRPTFLHKFPRTVSHDFAIALAFQPNGEELALLVNTYPAYSVQFYNISGLDDDKPPVLLRTATATRHYFPKKIVYSPDGSKLAGVGQLEVLLWTASNYRSYPKVFEPGTRRFRQASWFPDNEHLAAVTEDNDILIWNTTNDDRYLRNATVFKDMVEVPRRQLGKMHIRPDGKYFAIGSRPTSFPCPTCGGDDFAVNIFDTQDGSLKATLSPAHSTWIGDLKYSPDGTKLASSAPLYSGLGELYIWDANTGELQWTFRPSQQDGFASVAWSPDSRYVACHIRSDVEGLHQLIYIFDTVEGGDPALVMEGTPFDRSSELAWSADGKYLAVRNYEPELYRIEEQK